MNRKQRDSHSKKKKKEKTIKVAQKRQVGRPPKDAGEKTVSSFHYPCRAEEHKTIELAIKRLTSETGGIIDVNRQLVIRLLLRRLETELKTAGFSVVETYLRQE